MRDHVTDWLVLGPDWQNRASQLGEASLWPCCSTQAMLEQVHSEAPSAISVRQWQPALDKTFAEIRDWLINLDETLEAGAGSELAWEACDLADRGPYASPLGRLLAQRLILAREQRAGGTHAVAADSTAVARALAGDPAFKPPSARIATLRAWTLGAARSLKRFAQCRRQRRQVPAQLDRLRDADVILTVWATPDTFRKGGPRIGNTNFGCLPAILEDAGLKVAYLANPLHWEYSYQAILDGALESGLPVLMPEDCLQQIDVAAALRLAHTQPRPDGPPVILDGIDVSGVIALETARIRATWRGGQAGLYADVGRGLSRLDIHPTALILPFEGQTWERCLRHGLRQHLPGTRILGLQHAPFGPNFLSFFPSRRDLERCRHPDGVLTMGPHYTQCLTAAGVPKAAIFETGAVRYSGLTPRNGIGARPTESATIAIATTIDGEETAALLGLAVAGLAGQDNCRLLANFHPHLNRERAAALRRAFKDHIQFVEGGIRDLLGDADALLYNSSAAAFDALAAGVPVVFMARDGHISQDKVPSGLTHHCDKPGDLPRIIADILAAPKRPAIEDVRRCLAPVNGSVAVTALGTFPC